MKNNNKILLVFPGQKSNPFQKSILVNLPLSVLQLAAYLLERGFEVVVHDTRIDNQDEFREKARNCMAAGFSCMTGLQIKYSLMHAALFKEVNPGSPIIFGGIHPSLFPEQTLLHPLVDFVVKGEGEESLFQLANTLKTGMNNFDQVPGIGYKKHGQHFINQPGPFIDLDSLPLPAYHCVDVRKYPHILSSFDYQTSRGCPYRCAFCYNLAFCKSHYRVKSAEKVVKDLTSLIETYGVNKFAFVDDEFFINKNRVEKYCDLVIEKKLALQWHASCRLNVIRNYPVELLDKIRKSGCGSMNFGAESGSPRILEYIKKDITTEDIVEGARHTSENGIKSYMSFMSGFPQETMEDTLATKEMIGRLHRMNNRIVANAFLPYNPYPGTPLFDEAVKNGGLKLPDNLESWGNWSFQYNAKFPWVSHKHNQMIKVLFCIVRLNFYLSELKDRFDFSRFFRFVVLVCMSPWIAAGRLRWRYNFYKMPWEMDLWLFLMKKVFGFV